MSVQTDEKEILDKYNERLIHRQEWISKNSLPKCRTLPKIIKIYTRFQKPGPMTEDDWKRFEDWAKIRAISKLKYEVETENNFKIGTKRNLDKTRLTFLSTPLERHVKEKFVQLPKPKYTYVPKINKPDRKKSRPRRLPKTFVDANDFPLPIKKSALKYKATEYLLRLSLPRKIRGKEEPVRSKKMTPKQWKLYEKYLKILSFPKIVSTYLHSVEVQLPEGKPQKEEDLIRMLNKCKCVCESSNCKKDNKTSEQKQGKSIFKINWFKSKKKNKLSRRMTELSKPNINSYSKPKKQFRFLRKGTAMKSHK